MKGTDGLLLNGYLWKNARMLPAKRVHMVTTGHVKFKKRMRHETICGRLEKSKEWEVEWAPMAEMDCPCCIRVLRGRPPDKGKDLIPLDKTWEEIQHEMKTPKPDFPEYPPFDTVVEPTIVTHTEPSIPTSPPPAPPAKRPSRKTTKLGTVTVADTITFEEVAHRIPSQPMLDDQPLVCSFTYPNGFRHEPPGPRASHQLWLAYGSKVREAQVVETSLCPSCYKQEVAVRANEAIGQGIRGRIMRIFDLKTLQQIDLPAKLGKVTG